MRRDFAFSRPDIAVECRQQAASALYILTLFTAESLVQAPMEVMPAGSRGISKGARRVESRCRGWLDLCCASPRRLDLLTPFVWCPPTLVPVVIYKDGTASEFMWCSLVVVSFGTLPFLSFLCL